MVSDDLIKLGKRALENILKFIQTHLIAQGCRWTRKRAYAGWKAVQERLTTCLYDIITDLLRIQYRQDTLHLTGMLQVIADSIEDNTQSEDCTVKGLNILPHFNLGSQHSPLDGVILKVLQSHGTETHSPPLSGNKATDKAEHCTRREETTAPMKRLVS